MPPSARILMCPPEYYGIEYEINPWMDRSRVLARFKAERPTLAMIDHPNIVQLQEVLASHSKIYLVLDLIKGGDLFDKLKGKTLPL